jgi:hypothetical protein
MPIIPISGSAAAHGALIPLASTTGNGVGGEIAFANIPQGYQDLMMVASVTATTNLTAFAYSYFTVYGTGMSTTYMRANGLLAQSVRTTGANGVFPYAVTYLHSLYPTSVVMHILNYSSSTNYKQVITRSAQNYDGDGNVNLTSTLIQSLAPVTLIDFATFAAGGIFAKGSTFTLYGVRSIGQ